MLLSYTFHSSSCCSDVVVVKSTLNYFNVVVQDLHVSPNSFSLLFWYYTKLHIDCAQSSCSSCESNNSNHSYFQNQWFPTFFGSRRPYLVMKIFGGTPSCFNRYKDQGIVITGGTSGTSHGNPVGSHCSRHVEFNYTTQLYVQDSILPNFFSSETKNFSVFATLLGRCLIHTFFLFATNSQA